jgi:hypothetical protein
MPEMMTPTLDCKVEQEGDIAEAKLPMRARVAVFAGTTLLLWGGSIAALWALSRMW